MILADIWTDWLLYSLCGVLAGLVSGMFGLGGGVVVVPFLAWFFLRQGFPEKLIMLMAVATSMATIVVTSIAAVAAHHRLGNVQWDVAGRLAPGLLLGALLGAALAERLPVPLFKLFFAGFLITVALRMVRGRERTAGGELAAGPGLFWGAGLLIGSLSAMLGIGGGTLSVPFLARCGYPLRIAVAVSSACGFPLALAGTLGYAYLGWNRPELPFGSAGYVYLPGFAGIVLTSIPFAPAGAWLAHRLPTRELRWAFAVVLCGVGARLIWQVFGR